MINKYYYELLQTIIDFDERCKQNTDGLIAGHVATFDFETNIEIEAGIVAIYARDTSLNLGEVIHVNIRNITDDPEFYLNGKEFMFEDITTTGSVQIMEKWEQFNYCIKNKLNEIMEYAYEEQDYEEALCLR
jgi:hypothetical protein